jgi:hypothetical protein
MSNSTPCFPTDGSPSARPPELFPDSGQRRGRSDAYLAKDLLARLRQRCGGPRLALARGYEISFPDQIAEFLTTLELSAQFPLLICRRARCPTLNKCCRSLVTGDLGDFGPLLEPRLRAGWNSCDVGIIRAL